GSLDRIRAASDWSELRDLPSDSALDELSVGRFWHGALMLRVEGMASSAPENVLLLAAAEAGWNNWPGVQELLEDADWLEDVGGAEGLFLLGRVFERAERWSEAAEAFDRYMLVADVDAAERPAARVRGARSWWRAGDHVRAEDGLDALVEVPMVRSWLAADLVRETVEAGDTSATRALIERVSDEIAAAGIWRAEADALLAAGDSVRAARALEALAEPDGDGRLAVARASEAKVDLGRLRLAVGDSAAARALFGDGFEGASGAARTRAAQGLVDLRAADREGYLRLASILDRAGDGRRALIAYDRAHRLAADAGARLPDGARLERARLMATVRNRQPEALDAFRELRETLTDRRLAARNLRVWAQMRQRQGLTEQVRTLRGWLVEEYPESGEAAEIVFMRGYDAENAGRMNEALRHYDAVAETARTHARAGQARMRAGQIELSRGALDAAAGTFEAYLEDFPEGRRWEEAAYWAGRVRLEIGDHEAGVAHLRRVMGQPISYYAVMAADLIDEPFSVELPAGVAPEEPQWLTDGLARLDMLERADLTRGADAEVARLTERASGNRPVMLALAEALIERGRTIDGINLGWAMLAEGDGWDEAVLRVTFPFPYRELVRREAAEWGVDPIMLAALIRQESAFKVDIVSHAGAIGLMQVMPPTGEQLARVHGPVGFSSAALSTPEVNLHLGSAFLVDMTRRFGALPLVLSAYNAGPTRATRWRQFPEASDDLRFTERIPFVETRGYVKNVRRNLGIYRLLYGEE
ncbi:MAG: transglycosylase SLT domain-containing protein, partial [Gemmatimonadota bacterium]